MAGTIAVRPVAGPWHTARRATSSAYMQPNMEQETKTTAMKSEGIGEKPRHIAPLFIYARQVGRGGAVADVHDVDEATRTGGRALAPNGTHPTPTSPPE